MKKLLLAALSLPILALLAGPAAAQVKIQPIVIGQRGGNTLELVKDKGVQEELKLSKQQAERIAKLVKEQKEAVADLKGVQKFKKLRELMKQTNQTVRGLLKPAQTNRLQELQIQQRGPRAFITQPVAKDLNITKEQRKEIIQIIRDAAPKRRQIIQQNKGNLKKRQEQISKLNQEIVQDITKKLSAEQKKQWKAIAGEPYKGVLPARGFGGIIRIQPNKVRPLPVQPLPVQPKKIKVRPKVKKQG